MNPMDSNDPEHSQSREEMDSETPVTDVNGKVSRQNAETVDLPETSVMDLDACVQEDCVSSQRNRRSATPCGEDGPDTITGARRDLATSSDDDEEEDMTECNTMSQREQQRHSGRSFMEHTSNGMHDFDTIPDALRYADAFPMDVYDDYAFHIPDECRGTMDSVSRCMKLLPEGHQSLLTEKIDGRTWAFVFLSNSQLSEKVQRALYFFHMLQEDIRILTKYVIPTDVISIRNETKRPDVSYKLTYRKYNNLAASSLDEDDGLNSRFQFDMRHFDKRDGVVNAFYRDLKREFGVSSYLKQNPVQMDDGMEVPVPIMKMRIAFSGVRYSASYLRFNKTEEGNEIVRENADKKNGLCVLFVTFARNFEVLKYIEQEFLQRKRGVDNDGINTELNSIWQDLIRDAGYSGLEMDEEDIANENDFAFTPCGKFGVDRLFSMFQVVFSIVCIDVA